MSNHVNLTYDSQVAKDADKALLDQCREALNITRSVMRIDDCGLWNLAGKRGRITTWGDGTGYLLAIYERDSKQAWTWAKKRLAFAKLTQNAEIEGVFRFELPIKVDQAAEIRDLAGLRVAPTEEYRTFLSEQALRRGVGRRTADAGSPGIPEPPDTRGHPAAPPDTRGHPAAPGDGP